MKLRLGKELTERVKVIADRYGKSMANIVERADRAWWKLEQAGSVAIDVVNESATGDGAIITVKSDREPKELRAVIDWYILRYENMTPEPTKPLPDSIKKQAEQMVRAHRKVAAMTRLAEAELIMKELETEEVIEV